MKTYLFESWLKGLNDIEEAVNIHRALRRIKNNTEYKKYSYVLSGGPKYALLHNNLNNYTVIRHNSKTFIAECDLDYIIHDGAAIKHFAEEPAFADLYLKNVHEDGDDEEILKTQEWYDKAKSGIIMWPQYKSSRRIRKA